MGFPAMSRTLQDKVVFISGGSSGFGADAARLFAREGCRVVVAARRMDRLNDLVAEITREGGKAMAIRMDISKYEQVKEAARLALEKEGRVDILFNNAGIPRLDWLERLDPLQDVAKQLEINLTGQIHLTQVLLPGMLERRSGIIINMCSVAGWIAAPIYTIYAASKHGLRGFTDALRREVSPFGIKVCGIHPGGAETEFGELAHSRISRGVFKGAAFLNMSSEYVARQVVRLAKHPRRTVILPWWYVPLIGLERTFPGVVDWLLRVFFVRRLHQYPSPGESEASEEKS